MSMASKNSFWDEVDAGLAKLVPPISEIKYRLYYNTETMRGEIISADELEGPWINFPAENIGIPPMDWLVKKDGTITREVFTLPTRKKLIKGGTMFYTLRNDYQFAVDADYPAAIGWYYD